MITIDPEKVTTRALANLDAEFERKKAVLTARISTAILADGASQASKTTTLQVQYAALVDEYTAAVDAVLFG